MRCSTRITRVLLTVGVISLFAVPGALAKIEAGEHIPINLDTPQGYKGAADPQGEWGWSYTLKHTGASYIAIHFVDFDLAPGDYLVVSDPVGEQFYTLEGRGKMNAGTFWARHIRGDTVELSLFKVNPQGGRGFVIDEYVAGWLDLADQSRAICGTDDKENAICYETSHPTEYDRGRAVCRLLSNGSAFCTGWLCSATNHVMTNEHCVSSASAALNTDFDFMAEAPTCETQNCSECFPGYVYSGATFIQDSANLDYCLMVLNVQAGEPDPATTYGFLELDDRVAIPGEEIYIIGHPGGRAKEMTIFSTHANDPTGIPVVHSITEPPCSGSGYYDVGYFADTEGGSSGSPVLARSSHKVIALHHCANCPNRGVPIHLVHDEVGEYLTPGPAGEVRLNKDIYGCTDSVNIELRDGDLLGAGSHDLQLTTTGGDSETITVIETGAGTGIFIASVNTLAGAAVPDNGMLDVSHGEVITATYIDADDGQGGTDVVVTDMADVDCQAPQILNVEVTDVQPRSATITITANEPVVGVVHYGLTCGDLSWSTTGSGYDSSAVVNVTGLQDNTAYFFAVEAFDEGNNGDSDDNNGNCYGFVTPEVPDFFTEQFDGDNDLDNVSLQFVPNGSNDFYYGCTQSIDALPTPPGGTTLSLSDDDNEEIALSGGATVLLYGVEYSSVYVGSNGYLTFTAGDTDYSETLEEHFETPRISAVYDDLNPSSGGTITYEQFADRLVITFDAVEEYSTGALNTFQYELFFSGQININYLDVNVIDGIAGLSAGGGLDPDFFESDLSAMWVCEERPPQAFDGFANVGAGNVVGITLDAADDGLPDPPAALTFIITELAEFGTLTDPQTGEVITEVPYVLANQGDVVEYFATPYYVGADGFAFKANDGGTPDSGGDSNVASVSITITDSPRKLLSFPLESDPGWSVDGEWAFGQPTGGGTHGGDPFGGYTGDFVYGYNLAGDYASNMAPMYLTTPVFDFADVVDVELRFYRWLGVEAYDAATVEVSPDGGATWNVIWQNSGLHFETAWSLHAYDISAVADQAPALQIRWGMGPTDASVTYPGWNIDDVELWGMAPHDVCPGDANCDGVITFEDIRYFVTALSHGYDGWYTQHMADTGIAPTCPWENCDANGAGGVTFEDIMPFANLIGTPCP